MVIAKRVLKLLPLLFVLGGCAQLLAPKVNNTFAELKSGQYTLDPAHSTLLFKVGHLGLSTYVGRFNALSASLDFDPSDPAKSRLDARIEMNSIDVQDPDFSKTLAGDSWLDSAQFPQARFTTTQAKALPNNRLEFTGQLNFRGVTAPVTLEATFHGGAHNLLSGYYTLGFSAEGKFRRSTFGLDQHIPLVSDEVKIEVYAEFLRSDPS